MGPEIVNKNKNSIFHGDYVGHDNITVNIVMLKDSEREFVVTHNANIKPVAYFTGRETELQDLRQRIAEGKKSVLVSGMGGIGKTHICRKLFEEYLKKYIEDQNCCFRHIGYIEYDGDMNSSLQNCLKFKHQDNPEHNLEAAWRELEYLASNGKLLLFVDNVNVSTGDDPCLKRLMGIPGAIVLTSRRRAFSKELEPYRIGFLNFEKCKEIYEKIRFENSSKKVAEEEVPDLEYIIDTLAARHTITVEFLAHLAWTKHWTVQELRNELEENRFQLEYMDEEDKLVNIQKSYETLYDMSALTEAEQNILEAFSVFSYIPLAAETCNEWLLADAGVSEDDDILMGLYQKGWLQFDVEQESYALHPVFAQFIYDKCKPELENHLKLVEACQRKLAIPNSGSALECQKYIPFAENMVKKLGMGNNLEQVNFISAIAYLLYYVAEYKKAETLYEKSLRIRERVLGEEHPSTATSYYNLARVYQAQGKYEKAEGLYEKSLRIRERVLGEEHLSTAASYNNLAGVYQAQGKYEKAEGLYEKSLQISEKVLGEEHASTTISYNNLAGAYYAQGEYEKAKRLYEKSLRIKERVLGEEHPSTAKGYNNLAGVYYAQGEYHKAMTHYLKAYIILLVRLGTDHPNTGVVLKNMRIAYYKWNPEGDFSQWLEEKMKNISDSRQTITYAV